MYATPAECETRKKAVLYIIRMITVASPPCFLFAFIPESTTYFVHMLMHFMNRKWNEARRTVYISLTVATTANSRHCSPLNSVWLHHFCLKTIIKSRRPPFCVLYGVCTVDVMWFVFRMRQPALPVCWIECRMERGGEGELKQYVETNLFVGFQQFYFVFFLSIAVNRLGTRSHLAYCTHS